MGWQIGKRSSGKNECDSKKTKGRLSSLGGVALFASVASHLISSHLGDLETGQLDR